MYRKRLVVIILGLIMAAGSSYGMLRLNCNLEKTISVVAVREIIHPYEEFTMANVKMSEISASYVLPGALTALNEVIGQKAGATIYPGEQVIKEKIGHKKTNIAAEDRFLFIKTDNILLNPGELVDIYAVDNSVKYAEPRVEKILSDKIIASVIDEVGNNIFKNEWPNVITRKISGIEVIATEEEILRYLEKSVYAKSVIVRH